MNSKAYIKDVYKLIQSDSDEICKGRKFKIHKLTLKDKLKSKREVEILLFDGINYYNSVENVNLKNCKMVIKLDGEVKYESDKGIFKNTKISYKAAGKFSFKEFIKLNTPDPIEVNLKSIDFSRDYHRNQYHTFRKLIACQIKLDNALRNFIESNTFRINKEIS